MAKRERETPAETVDEVRLPKGRTRAAGVNAGDSQGLSEEEADLTSEGQGYEAELLDSIENAPLPDEGELRTREVPEDDVPGEYADRDLDEPKED